MYDYVLILIHICEIIPANFESCEDIYFLTFKYLFIIDYVSLYQVTHFFGSDLLQSAGVNDVSVC